jgi:AmmeMemoRadiSam system protein B
VRPAAVAGLFYEQNAKALRKHLDTLWPAPLPAREPCLGAMVPHAGYLYSGKVAAQVYARLAPCEAYVLLGPNHAGRGLPLALSRADAWETPLGAVSVDRRLSKKILEACPAVREEDGPHGPEHSLEVQLPFLQSQGHRFSIAALLIGTWDLQILQNLGAGLADAIQREGRPVCILASSDMNHFDNLERTRQQDRGRAAYQHVRGRRRGGHALGRERAGR